MAFDDELHPARLGPPPTTMLAGLLARSLAAFVDINLLTFLMILESFLLIQIFGLSVERDISASDIPYFLITFTTVWLYFAGFDSGSRGATPGKRLLGIEVVDLSGERIGFLRASFRFLLRGLTMLCFLVGWLMIAATQRQQALHDVFARTLVIHSAARTA